MTNQQHPITPPPELMRHWSRFQGDTDPEALWFRIANEAAQWGADHELEACCEWLNRVGHFVVGGELRAARRPKPPSLKEQAMEWLIAAEELHKVSGIDPEGTIRRALEQLDD